jgi:hypothetical protein
MLSAIGGLMRRIALVLSLVLLSATFVELKAQSTATFHVFPQVADGLLSDGSAYYSTLVAVNVGTNAATCTIRLYGAVSNRVGGSATLTIPASGGVGAMNTAITTGSILPLATGYGTLSCDRPVAAQVGYFYVAPGLPNFSLLGAATVFSSPPTTRAELFATNVSGFHSALAIANDTDTPATYQINVITATGQPVATASVSVGARLNVAKFLDELVQLPANFAGAAIINASTAFSAVGLLFHGSTFLSVAAVPFVP